MNKAKFFDLTRLLRVVFVILPLGLGFLIIGGEKLFIGVDKLYSINGVVENIYEKNKYYSRCECPLNTFFVEIEQNEDPCYTKIKNKIEVLRTQIEMGDQVVVWVDDEDNLEIEQVQRNGEIIIRYNRLLGMSLIFIIFGTGLIVLSFYALISSYKESIKGQ